MAKRIRRGSSRRNADEAASGVRSRAAARLASRGDYNPYSEDLIDRIVAEWDEAVPGQDSVAREISAVIARIAALYHMDSARVLARYRLSDTEFHLLGGLRRAGGAPPYRRSPSELIPRYVPVTSGGLSGVISRLERRDLVRRREDPLDGRGVLVELTEAGRQMIEEIMALLAHREALLTVNLKPSERRQAARLLRCLLRAANVGFALAHPD